MEKNKTSPSLREQIIDAMNAHAINMGWADRSLAFNRDMFDQAIMPVLKRAMNAGDLLLGRNTKERVPVPEAVIKWLEMVIMHVELIQSEESTISRRKCLDVIYQFGKNAELSLSDIKRN